MSARVIWFEQNGTQHLELHEDPTDILDSMRALREQLDPAFISFWEIPEKPLTDWADMMQKWDWWNE